MHTKICEMLEIEYPILGFTPSPEVAAAISRAGGLGVLGAVRYSDPDELARDLDWMDAHVDGKPYGLDIVMPQKFVGDDDLQNLEHMVPEEHKAFIEGVLQRHGVPPLPEGQNSPSAITGWMHSVARRQVELAYERPGVKLLANALGSPPKDIIDECHEHGILVAALAGKPKHAASHVAAGVDIIVAVGHEAGGHTGEVTTMVLVPEIVDAVGDTPVLAAGGIGTGRQVAASFALGAEGVWLGSVWLTAEEYRLEPPTESGHSVVKHKLLEATSSDTVRSRVISGKPARMLRTPWTEAWEDKGSPGTLPMPLQGILVADAEARIRKVQNPELLGTPVGQIVGQMNEVVPVETIIKRLVDGFRDATARMIKVRG
ncbi:MAG: nitronate monooxygenase [Myxococcales bacterium]|nr:nitronate monooxygenase [Myxococcales bacterium]